MAGSNDPRHALPSDALESLSAPLGDLIAAVGRGVADAQRAMDAATIASLRELNTGTDDLTRTLRGIGYQPTWYRIPKVEAELTISLTISGRGGHAEGAQPGDGKLQLFATPIDATYTNMYEYDLRATSKLRFSIVPVPSNTEIRFVPNVSNLSFEKAKELLEAAGIAYTIDGDASGSATNNSLVVSTNPPPGSAIPNGASVELRFTR